MTTTEQKTTTINLTLPELGMPCMPGNSYHLHWNIRGDRKGIAAMAINLVYDWGLTIPLASDIPSSLSGWQWDVGTMEPGTARLQVIARGHDGEIIDTTYTQQFTVAGETINGAMEKTNGHEGLEARLIRPLPYPYPYPTPLPYPTPTPTTAPSITSISPNQLIAGSNNNIITISGANLPVSPFPYTLVTSEGSPLFGVGIQLADNYGTSSNLRLQLALSSQLQSMGARLRVSTGSGTAEFPVTIIGTLQFPRIDYIDPSLIYVYPSGSRQTFQVLVGGASLPVVSSQYRLEGAPYGVTFDGIVFANPSSAVIRLAVEPFLPSGDYYFTIVAGTARGQIRLIKF